jgi:hypothetical protein
MPISWRGHSELRSELHDVLPTVSAFGEKFSLLEKILITNL